MMPSLGTEDNPTAAGWPQATRATQRVASSWVTFMRDLTCPPRPASALRAQDGNRDQGSVARVHGDGSRGASNRGDNGHGGNSRCEANLQVRALLNDFVQSSLVLAEDLDNLPLDSRNELADCTDPVLLLRLLV